MARERVRLLRRQLRSLHRAPSGSLRAQARPLLALRRPLGEPAAPAAVSRILAAAPRRPEGPGPARAVKAPPRARGRRRCPEGGFTSLRLARHGSARTAPLVRGVAAPSPRRRVLSRAVGPPPRVGIRTRGAPRRRASLGAVPRRRRRCLLAAAPLPVVRGVVALRPALRRRRSPNAVVVSAALFRNRVEIARRSRARGVFVGAPGRSLRRLLLLLVRPGVRVLLPQLEELLELVRLRREEGPPDGHELARPNVGARRVKRTHHDDVLRVCFAAVHLAERAVAREPFEQLEVGDAAVEAQAVAGEPHRQARERH